MGDGQESTSAVMPNPIPPVLQTSAEGCQQPPTSPKWSQNKSSRAWAPKVSKIIFIFIIFVLILVQQQRRPPTSSPTPTTFIPHSNKPACLHLVSSARPPSHLTATATTTISPK